MTDHAALIARMEREIVYLKEEITVLRDVPNDGLAAAPAITDEMVERCPDCSYEPSPLTRTCPKHTGEANDGGGP